LILNANDALAGIESPQIDVWIHDTPSGYVTVVIQDNGLGIPESLEERIFEPFFTTKLADEGTGLGLYICHQIVQECKGVIRVETSLEHGVRFFVQLPIVELRS